MPHYIMVFVNHKPGVTQAEHEAGFEKTMPTILKHTAKSFPVSHRRHYVKRADDGEATLEHGTQDQFNFDAVYLIEFEKEEDVARFRHDRHDSPVLKALDAEHSAIMPDSSTMRAVILSNVYETRASDILQQE